MQQTQEELGFTPRSFGSRLWSDESGQDMAEYAVLIALVALAVITAVVVLGDNIATTFNTIGTSMTGAEPPT
ncbi:MAG: Flp family type IVb pilin [Gemmatimonadota bacterium]